MELQTFNGGLNTRLAPQLIATNEAVEYNNIDNSSGTLKSVHHNSNTGIILGRYAYYFEAESMWISSSTKRHYLEYQQNLYYTESNAVPKYTDGTTEYLLGISAPTLKFGVSTSSSGILTGTYTYVMTFYNSTKGVESQPTPVSHEIVADLQSITLGDVKPHSLEVSSDPQVDARRIYRVGGNLTSFSLVDTIDNVVTSYVDNTADVDIPGDDMVATDYRQAPSGLNYLVEAYGIMFGAVDDKLYYSVTGSFTYWPATFFIDFPVTITGIAVIGIGVLVFTIYKTYIVTGTSRRTFSKRLFSADQGCVTFDSIQNVKSTLVWISTDGICVVAGALVVVVSRDKIGTVNLVIKDSAFHNEVYYALKSDNSIIAYDFRFTSIVKELNLPVTALVVGQDILYGYFNEGAYRELFVGNEQEVFTYKSPKLVDGSVTRRKIYKSVFIANNGEFELRIFITDELVLTKVIKGTGITEVKIPENKKDGYSIQFSLVGVGEILALDYTVAAFPK